MKQLPRFTRGTSAICWFICGCVVFGAENAEQPAAPPKKISRSRLAGDDWPSFLGPTGGNKSAEKGKIVWPETGPAVVWKVDLGTGYASPTISEGRLFQFDRQRNLARLRAVESETGKPLWEFTYPSDYQDLYGYDNGPRSSPVVDDQRVYIFGAEGMLHCLDAVTGNRIWKVDTVAEFGVMPNFFGVGSTPIVHDDLLLVQVGGSPPESQQVPPGQLDLVKSNGTAIVAFDKRTGVVKYHALDDLASYASPKLATVEGHPVCYLFARKGLWAFNPTNGALQFHFPWHSTKLESVNASNPVVVENAVLISETYGPGSALLRVKPGGYDVVWSDEQRRRDKAMQVHWNTPIYHQGYLYGSSGRHDANAELRCIEWSTGKVLWSQPDLSRSTLLYVDGHFVCLGEHGILRLLRANPEKYDEVARVRLVDEKGPFGSAPLLKYPAWTPPLLSHGLLYVRGAGRLVCLDLISEQPQKDR